MASDDFERLRAAVDDDPALRERLWRITSSSAFVVEIARVAAERDLNIDAIEIWDEMRRGRTAWLESWSP
jgi:hypothetical protein